jgi:hypothetical protein
MGIRNVIGLLSLNTLPAVLNSFRYSLRVILQTRINKIMQKRFDSDIIHNDNQALT